MHRSFGLASLLSLLGSLTAQAPTLSPERITLGIGAGLQREGCDWLGCGTNYKATFADGRLVYTPALGRTAPHDLPITMEVTHTGRGALQPVGTATTTAGELRVDVVRPQLREELLIRPEGLKQSFVFDRLPEGSGDLVVRTRITTELQPERNVSDSALRFTLPGCGGIEIGQVVGIDAAGARATGSLRTDGHTLDFVLPAAFVATAKLPLVVDPLLTSHAVTGANGDDRRPEICSMQAPANSFLVVWARVFSATNDDVRAQRVAATGGLIGGLLQLESTNASANQITVIDNQQTNKWFVCWEQAGDIVGRFVTSGGTVNPVISVVGTANNQIEPDLAGGRLGGNLGNGDQVVCVWRDSTANQIRGCRIDAVFETAGSEHTLATGSTFIAVGAPAVSPDNPSSTFLLTYVSTSSLLGSRSVRAATVATSTMIASASVAVAGTALVDATNPSCAGASGRWVVAYNTSGTLGNGLSCVSVEAFASQILVGTARTVAGPNGIGVNSSVGWFDGSAFVALTSVGVGGGSSRDVSVLSVDAIQCTNCEGLLPIDNNVDVDVAIASRVGNSPSVNLGAVAYVPLSFSVGDVEMRLLTAADGVTTNLGGGCTPGVLLAPCARAGNANFAVQMRGAAAGELTFAVHSTGSFGATGLPCGPCTIVPDSSIGIVQTVGVSTADGAIAVPLPLPGGASVVGVNVFSQCFFLGSDCLNLFRLTDAIRFTIE